MAIFFGDKGRELFLMTWLFNCWTIGGNESLLMICIAKSAKMTRIISYHLFWFHQTIYVFSLFYKKIWKIEVIDENIIITIFFRIQNIWFQVKELDQLSKASYLKTFYEARFLRSSASWQWDGENLVLLSQESFYYSQHFIKEAWL